MKIAEIAKEAGVSVGTVDRVLHKRGRVSAATKARIEKIIQENGYVPNAMARNLKIGSNLKFGILIPKLDSESGYWHKIYNGIKKAGDEIAAFNISLVIKEFDRDEENSLNEKGKQLIEENVDAIALAPVIQKEAFSFVKSLKDIPYAFFDSSITNASPISENIQIAYKAGWCGARVMQLFSPDNNNFICLQMHESAYNQQQRAQGFIDFFKQKNISIKTYTWKREKNISFNKFLDSLFEDNNKIDGIFITNDATGLISKYVLKKELSHTPYIIGFDLVEDNKEELLNGNISAIISQSPETQGYNTIMDMYKILFLKQEDSINKCPIPINIIIKENLP